MAAGDPLAASQHIVKEAFIDERNLRLLYLYAQPIEPLRIANPKLVCEYLHSGRFITTIPTEVGKALTDFRDVFFFAIQCGTIALVECTKLIDDYVDKGPQIFGHYD